MASVSTNDATLTRQRHTEGLAWSPEPLSRRLRHLCHFFSWVLFDHVALAFALGTQYNSPRLPGLRRVSRTVLCQLCHSLPRLSPWHVRLLIFLAVIFCLGCYRTAAVTCDTSEGGGVDKKANSSLLVFANEVLSASIPHPLPSLSATSTILFVICET